MKDIKQRLTIKVENNIKVENIIQTKFPYRIDGKLVISKMHGTKRFYWYHNGKREYLNKQRRDLLLTLAQKYYNTKVLEELGHQTNELKKALKIIDKIEGYKDKEVPDYVYENLPQEIKELTIKHNFTDEYAKNWQSVKYKRKPVPKDLPFYTAKNEHVRSKSELIIANMLNDRDIPYHYECPFELGDRIIHPDFLILNKRTKEVFIWEHFGKMDDTEYNAKVLTKIEAYIANGHHLGKKLIATFESSQIHLNLQIVSKLIAEYLL